MQMPTLELDKLGVESLENADALSQIMGGIGEQANVKLYGSKFSLNGTATYEGNGTAIITDETGTSYSNSPLVDPERDGLYIDPSGKFFANTQGNKEIALYFYDKSRRTPIYAPGYFR